MVTNGCCKEKEKSNRVCTDLQKKNWMLSSSTFLRIVGWELFSRTLF